MPWITSSGGGVFPPSWWACTLRCAPTTAVALILASCMTAPATPASPSVPGPAATGATASAPMPGAVPVPAAALLAVAPAAETSTSHDSLPAVAGAGWREVGLGGDISPPRALTWANVPILGAESIVIRSPIAPDSVYLFGFRSLDHAGIPVERDGVQTRCGQSSGAGQMSCLVDPAAQSTHVATVRISKIPPGIKYLTLQATWLLDPGSAKGLPAEVSRSWIARAVP